jgi:putative DNA primase/helicase
MVVDRLDHTGGNTFDSLLHMSTEITIPALAELQQKPQWVCWCYETRDGKRTKVPYIARNGRKASSKNPQTWSTYDLAIKGLQNVRTSDGRAFDGIGFVFNNDYTGIDLDHCVQADGTIDQWGQEYLALIDSYSELSPSNTGIHMIARGVLPETPDAKGELERRGRKIKVAGKRDPEAAIEMYCQGRFFTITGKHLSTMPDHIEDRQEAILQMFQAITRDDVPSIQKQTPQAKAPRPDDMTDDALIKKAIDAKNGTEFAALWRGSISGNGNDHSSADLALCNHLAFWTDGDAYRIDKLFRQSGLYRAGKWDRNARSGETYGEGTIARAIANCSDGYTGSSTLDDRDDRRESLYYPDDDNDSGNIHMAEHEEIPDLCSFDADDSGNGDALFALYGTQFLYCSARGWFVYNGRYWDFDPDGAEVKKKAVITLRLRRHAAVDQEKEAIIKCTKADDKRVNGCVNRFRTLVGVSIDEFDSNPDLLNCKNGVVDLRNGNLEPHCHIQRFTYCLSAEYGEADYTVWTNYLQTVVGGGQEVVDYLQKLAGYSFTGHTREEMLVYLFGPSRAGKGTFSETFMTLLPDPLARGVDFNSFTSTRDGDTSNFDLAPLKPSRMIFASESQKSQSLNPAKIKQLTGGDPITCCFKHKDHFTYKPQFKVWMLSNWPVNGDPEDDALWGRVRVIEFPNSFLGKEDKELKERLKRPESLKGVLYWAVQGAIQWYTLGTAGLVTPKTVEETTQTHRADQDYIQQWLDECSDDDDSEESWVANEDVIASYTDWCKNNNVQHPKGPKALAQSLKAKGYRISLVKKIEGKTKKGVGGIHFYNF